MKFFFIACLLIAATTVLLVGCVPHDGQSASGHSAISVPPPPVVGDLNQFGSCSAKPERTLTDSEKCQIEKLTSRCLPADDCMVQCISSRDGIKVGGGCEHVCFSGLHARPPFPPEWSKCFTQKP
jgi:hypothetical protein